jgi:hypothetical protein
MLNKFLAAGNKTKESQSQVCGIDNVAILASVVMHSGQNGIHLKVRRTQFLPFASKLERIV